MSKGDISRFLTNFQEKLKALDDFTLFIPFYSTKNVKCEHSALRFSP